MKESGIEDIWAEIYQLSCSAHEEADERMIAHIHFTNAAIGCQRIVVHATDILCMYLFGGLPLSELWIEKKEQFMVVHTLIRSLCEHTQRSDLATTDCLLISYVLTGCDTVIRKRNAANCALKMICCLPHVSEFGRENTGMDIRKVHIDKAREFFVALYEREGFKSLDVLRDHLWSSGKGDLKSLQPIDYTCSVTCIRCPYRKELV